MADISYTSGNVVATGADTVQGTSGATLVAGKAVYKDKADNLWKMSDANVAAAAKVHGMTLNGASLGQPVTVMKGGTISFGAALAPGQPYFLSPNSGNICPASDLTSGCYAVLIGIAASATDLPLSIVNGTTPIP